MKRTAFAISVLFAASAFAQDVPMPKMFGALAKQKGQYQVEMLEGGGRAGAGKAPKMTSCSDNLMKPPAAAKGAKDAARGDANCKHRLLKDTADEAVMETACPGHKSTVTMRRESSKVLLMEVASAGKSGTHNAKIRYTHLGPCREGQSSISLDKDSAECRQIRQQAAMMDPAKQCAGAGASREMCEKQMRDAARQMTAMCN